MAEMSPEEVRQLIELGYERQGVEYKGPGPWKRNSDLYCKVLRAMLGMANRRDGGKIIVGVDEESGSLKLMGLSEQDQPSWKYDDIASHVALYADPTVDFDLQTLEVDGVVLAILHVREFEDYPVICKGDLAPSSGKQIMRKGACYVRPRGRPETSELPNHHEMRDLLDLATEKRLRRMVAQLDRAGISLGASPPPSNSDRFSKELGDMWE